MLGQAIEAEVAEWIQTHLQLDADGRRQVVRNGFMPERSIVTGLGEIAVNQPRVHDRRPAQEREHFTSKILPPYLRKTKAIEELIPWLAPARWRQITARCHSRNCLQRWNPTRSSRRLINRPIHKI